MPDEKLIRERDWLLQVLKRIATNYESAEKIKRTAEKRYGLSGDEALEMAYGNIQSDARAAVKGMRRRGK